jgi:hypothetical protein
MQSRQFGIGTEQSSQVESLVLGYDPEEQVHAPPENVRPVAHVKQVSKSVQ